MFNMYSQNSVTVKGPSLWQAIVDKSRYFLIFEIHFQIFIIHFLIFENIFKY